MLNKKKIIAIIPARGGSKGIPNKNIVRLNGVPLVAYTVEAAVKSQYIDNVVVSTDSIEIAEIGKLYGANVPFMRPMELAGDTAKTIDTMKYTLDKLEQLGELYDYAILLQPTSPLRLVEHIDGAIEKIIYEQQDNIVSVNLVSDNPVLIRQLDENMHLFNILEVNSTVRRQDFEEYYKINGAIYINKTWDIQRCQISLNDNNIPFIMDSIYSIDIDDEKDLAIAEMILRTSAFKK